MNSIDRIDELLEPYRTLGDRHYGEDVTQRDHMLQTAWHAARSEATDSLVAAALLHDYGHFLQRLGEDAAERGRDARHESIGAGYLARYFGPDVTQPIALHVEAKRYLCATNPGYLAGLSHASRLSLAVQGGPLSADACAVFLQHPYAQDAVRLRRFDDMGKISAAAVPGIDSYHPLLSSLSLKH